MQPIGVCGDPGRQQLQRDRTIELRIVRSVDLAHAAGADPLDDAIAADGAIGQLVGPAIQYRGGGVSRNVSACSCREQRTRPAVRVDRRRTCLRQLDRPRESRTTAASKIALTRTRQAASRSARGQRLVTRLPRSSRALTVAGDVERLPSLRSSCPKKRSSTMRACAGPCRSADRAPGRARGRRR